MKNNVIFVQIIGLVFLSGLGLGEPILTSTSRFSWLTLGCHVFTITEISKNLTKNNII